MKPPDKSAAALNIFDLINIAVIPLLVPMMDTYPVLENLMSQNKISDYRKSWDFFMTVGGVGTFLLTHKDNLNDTEVEKIIHRLEAYDKQMSVCLNNFFDFVDNNRGRETDWKSVLGFWILWNLKGAEPTYEESKDLAPAIGAALFQISNSVLAENINQDKGTNEKRN